MAKSNELRGIAIHLPDAEVEDLVGAIEVLVQVGFSTFSLPVSYDGLADVIAMFAPRARFGASAVCEPGQVTQASLAGADFVLGDLASAEIAAAAAAAELECLLPAMTPTEVRAVLELPGVKALLYPADAVGHIMAQRLASLGLLARVVPLGGVGAYAAGEWLKAGAPAAFVDSALLGDALTGGSLAKLRDRSGSFLGVHQHALQAE